MADHKWFQLNDHSWKQDTVQDGETLEVFRVAFFAEGNDRDIFFNTAGKMDFCPDQQDEDWILHCQGREHAKYCVGKKLLENEKFGKAHIHSANYPPQSYADMCGVDVYKRKDTTPHTYVFGNDPYGA